MKRIKQFEPWFFLFFSVFHLHCIWGLINPAAYTAFWLGAAGFAPEIKLLKERKISCRKAA